MVESLDNDETISLEIPTDVYEKIERAASLLGMSMNDFILYSISVYIEDIICGEGYNKPLTQNETYEIISVLDSINELQ